jgi:hypothetical protein
MTQQAYATFPSNHTCPAWCIRTPAEHRAEDEMGWEGGWHHQSAHWSRDPEGPLLVAAHDFEFPNGDDPDRTESLADHWLTIDEARRIVSELQERVAAPRRRSLST